MKTTLNSKISKKALHSMQKRASVVALQKKLIIIVAVLVASIICIFGSTIITFANGENEKELVKSYTSVEIQAGDSLWSIAENYTSDFKINIEDYINDIISTNNLTSKEVHAGQFIIVPEYHYEYEL